jgi:hypothetical protein
VKFYIVILLLLGLPIVLSCYKKYQVEIILADNDHFQGIQLRFGLPLYRFEKIYDYTDPQLSILEALVIDRWDRSVGEKVDWNWERVKHLCKTFNRFKLFFDWEKMTFFIFKKALAYTVVEKIDWQSRVGGRDAMWVALQVGFLWAVKGMSMAFLARNSRLEQVKLGVKPDFQSPELNSQINCILKMRIVHIITIAVYLIVWKVRGWINGFRAKTREQSSH